MRTIEQWYEATDPEANAMYRAATERLVRIANDYICRIAADAADVDASELASELAKNAHNMFIQRDPHEQARLLKMLVSNCTFDRGSLSRLLFKGGTSLSKSFGLINRFSEDIDNTVFRHDLGQDASVEELEALSGKKRRAKLEAIKEACQTFIAGSLRRDLGERAGELMSAGGIPPDRCRVELDAHDPDQQTLLFWYPVVATAGDGYVRSAVKIEAGAKSALDPSVETSVRPYVADDLRT